MALQGVQVVTYARLGGLALRATRAPARVRRRVRIPGGGTILSGRRNG